MKKLAPILLAALILFFGVRISLAEEEESRSPFQVRKDRVEEKRDTSKERTEDRKEEVRARAENLKEKREELQEKRKENLARFLQKMAARLRAMVTRLETLISRIESRIEKIATENPDTDLSSIKADTGEAKAILALTKDKISELEGMEEDLTTSETPKTVFEELRGKLDSIKNDLKKVHSLLVHVIGDLKGLRVGDNKNEAE